MLVRKENKILRVESVEEANAFEDAFYREYIPLCNSYKGKASALKTKYNKSRDVEEKRKLYDQVQDVYAQFDEVAIEYKKKIDAIATANRNDDQVYRVIKNVAHQFVLSSTEVRDRFNEVANYFLNNLDKQPPVIRLITLYKDGTRDDIKVNNGKELVQAIIDTYKKSWSIDWFYVTNKEGNVDLNSGDVCPIGLLVVSRNLKNPSGLLRYIKDRADKRVLIK